MIAQYMPRTMPKRHPLATLLLALAACGQAPVPAPPRVVEPRTGDQPAPRGDALLRRTMLAAHDAARAAVGVGPLGWDERLAADARGYAQAMAASGRFEHAVQPAGPGHEGENLWTGTRGAYAYAEMVGAWADERRDFVNGVTPAFSRTGRWQDVAHYTQMIWSRTTALGCATAARGETEYLVCRYAPPGNVVGERAY